jgi:hypothetical protein
MTNLNETLFRFYLKNKNNVFYLTVQFSFVLWLNYLTFDVYTGNEKTGIASTPERRG